MCAFGRQILKEQMDTQGIKSKKINRYYSQQILLDQIIVKDQARKSFKDIELLAKSIEENDLIQPITVMENKDKPNSVILLAGERRYRAFKYLGRLQIPAIVVPYAEDPGKILIKQLVENIHRDDLSVIEKADSILELSQQGLKATQIAIKVGMNQRSVYRYIQIAKLPTDIKNEIENTNHSIHEIEERFLFKKQQAVNDDVKIMKKQKLFSVTKKYIKISKDIFDDNDNFDRETILKTINKLKDLANKLELKFMESATRGTKNN